jgi:hypothetical protein
MVGYDILSGHNPDEQKDLYGNSTFGQVHCYFG